MNSNTPNQHQGNEINVQDSVVAPSGESAELLFNSAVKKLIHVNEWHTITDPSLSRFQLTDSDGKEIFRAVHEGDFIRVDVPAPGTLAGDGYDWVKVEDIDYRFEGTMDSLSIRVRPVPSPFHPQEGVAHFFDESTTSTFNVFKIGLTVGAGIYGRNEIPNLKSEKMLDNIRNAAVAAGAILGASKIQWTRLAKGILNIKE